MNFSELEILLNYRYLEAKAPLLVDVGGHQGFVSRPFAKKGWRIIAFEPEPRNRDAFEKNMSKYDHVTCIPKAVSDVTGDIVPFYVSNEHPGIHSLKPFHKTHKPAHEVETVRLDDALSELGITSVTVLKVDTEGADFLALKGLDFDRFRPELIMIEFMDDRSLENYGYTHHDVAQYMMQYNYTTYVSDWEPIEEYAKEGEAYFHHWIQCAKYPLNQEPSWGNLIFVPDQDSGKFESTLSDYMDKASRGRILQSIRNFMRRIPVARKLYHLTRN